MLILSIPGTKRSLYLLPMIAPLGIVTGAWLSATTRAWFYEKIDRYTHAILRQTIAIATAAALVALPFADRISVAAAHRHLHDVLGPISPTAWGLPGDLAGVILILMIHGIRLWKRDSPLLGPLTASLVLVLFALGSAAVFRAVDRAKDLHSLPSDLKRMGISTTTLSAITWTRRRVV